MTPLTVQSACAFRVLGDPILEDTSISMGGRLVLMGLQRFGRNGNPCFPSNEKIAKASGVSLATVKRALTELAKRGLIAIVTDDPSTPKGRRIDKLWMQDPSLHPTSNQMLPLEAQIEPLGDRLNLSTDLEAQIEPRPRGSNCASDLEAQFEPLVVLLERPRKTKTKTGESSSSVRLEGGGAKPEDPQVVEAVERARKLWPEDVATIAKKARQACKNFGPAEFLKGISIVEDRIRKKGGSPGWAYLLGVLKNGHAEGGLVMPSVAPRMALSPGYEHAAERRQMLARSQQTQGVKS